MIFQNADLKKIVKELSAMNAILDRIAVVLEREPVDERQVDEVKWVHETPQEEV